MMKAPNIRPHPRVARHGVLLALLLCLSLSGCLFVAAGTGIGASAGTAIGLANTPSSPDTTREGIPVGAAIRVALGTSRDFVGVRRSSSDTIWVRGAEVLIGRLEAAPADDTLVLVVSEARLADGATTAFPRNAFLVTVPREPNMRIQVLNLTPAITEGVLVGSWMGYVATIAFFMFVCAATTCLN